jgi:uncharacterized protein (DUF305 family)
MKRAILILGLLAAGCDRSNTKTNEAQASDRRTSAMRAYDDAAARMHAGMTAADRDPDVAFARGMIPHHRGAVQMALIELRHGKDPELRKLARSIVSTQQAEVAMLERWLEQRRAAPAAPAGSPAHGH